MKLWVDAENIQLIGETAELTGTHELLDINILQFARELVSDSGGIAYTVNKTYEIRLVDRDKLKGVFLSTQSSIVSSVLTEFFEEAMYTNAYLRCDDFYKIRGYVEKVSIDHFSIDSVREFLLPKLQALIVDDASDAKPSKSHPTIAEFNDVYRDVELDTSRILQMPTSIN